MPWNIKRNGTEYCVVKEGGEVVKCHTTRAKALAHQRALYANVDDVTKEMMLELLSDGIASITAVTKEEGEERYNLTIVSTAAIEDRTGETFTTEAMDFDILQAKESGLYPEVRVFHSPLLGIGQITSMERVGIFAIDRGVSYTDKFSLDVCKEIAKNNNGKWRASRGFRALEVELSCPVCSKSLIINKEHMVIGFRCPSCTKVHLSYKGMPSVKYTKARTFDVTVTDVPAVPMTSVGVTAFKRIEKEDTSMNKQDLRKRLIAAGIDEDSVDQRLESVDETQLKEFDELPDAVLKEQLFPEDIPNTDGELLLDPVVIKEIIDGVTANIAELLEGAELDMGDLEVELPEFKEAQDYTADITELKESVEHLTGLMEKLLEDDETRLKEMMTRNNRSRILSVRKSMKKTDMEDEEDEEDMEETANGTKVNKEIARQLGKVNKEIANPIVDGQGNQFSTMTDFVS